MPPKFKKDTTKYLQNLHEKLQIAQKYADVHSKQAQQRYAAQYKKRAKDKHFSVNDKVLNLQPDSTKSRVFSKFKGPATVVAVKSPYSYVVDLDEVKYRLHANQIRPYNVRADEVPSTVELLTIRVSQKLTLSNSRTSRMVIIMMDYVRCSSLIQMSTHSLTSRPSSMTVGDCR